MLKASCYLRSRLKLPIGRGEPRTMSAWPIPLRGSTEVIDLDPPAGDPAEADGEPTTSTETRASEKQLALTKRASPAGISCRSYGGTIASIQKRLRTSALEEMPR